MLLEVQCDKFKSYGEVRPPIRFHAGLNAVLGDDNRSNSIGKSTLLMILDFVFGGSDYVKKCVDVQENVKEHTINFTFQFGDELYYFCRNTVDFRIVKSCDENYNPLPDVPPLTIDEYCAFLAEKYGVAIEGLKWRGAVARFIRVYKRETMDEERPLRSAKDEKTIDTIKKYMQLYGKYSAVDAQIRAAAQAEDEKTTFQKSQTYQYIRIAKNDKEYNENEARAVELEQRERELAAQSDQGLLDLDSVQAHQLSVLQDQLANCRRQRARIQTQLNAIRKEMTEGKKSFKRTYTDLERFFPGVEFKAIEDVEQFHQTLSRILTEEFKESERDLASAYVLLGNEIDKIKKQIEQIQSIPNVTQAVLREYSEITTQLNLVREANKNYSRLKHLKETSAEYAKVRDEVIADQLRAIESTVNQAMREITIRLVNNPLQLSPVLRLESLTKYTFNTPNDGGSGAQWRGVVAFDLASLQTTPVPFVVHDSDVLDPVEKPALTQIVKEYDAQRAVGKQVFASFRSMDFYEPAAQEIISACKVIELSSGGNELFGWAWNKENEDDADGDN